MLFVWLLIYCYCYCVIVDNISRESGVCDKIGRVQFKGLSVPASTAEYVRRDRTPQSGLSIESISKQRPRGLLIKCANL